MTSTKIESAPGRASPAVDKPSSRANPLMFAARSSSSILFLISAYCITQWPIDGRGLHLALAVSVVVITAMLHYGFQDKGMGEAAAFSLFSSLIVIGISAVSKTVPLLLLEIAGGFMSVLFVVVVCRAIAFLLTEKVTHDRFTF